MELITLTKENLEKEHICCAISNNNDIQVSSKKAWLADRLDEGLMFKKGDVRGKCFIEYIPAEFAWAPIIAPGYMYIDCLWMSGQYKGQGNSTLLLDECIADSKEKGKKGLCVLSSKKKQAFLSDPKFLKYKGFTVCDTADPSFELYYLPFDNNEDKPRFKETVKQPHIDKKGFVLYYTHQCPYTAKYVPIIENIAKSRGVQFESVHITTTAEAQNSPAPVTTYCMFYNGEYITNEIFSDKKFIKLLDDKGL